MSLRRWHRFTPRLARKNTVYCDAPVHADGDGHVPAHQVSSNWGLEPSSPKHQDIRQAVLRSQQAKLCWDDSSIFGRHGITQHNKQSDGYPESTDDDADPESDHGEELPIETSQEMDHASQMAVVDGMSEVQLIRKAWLLHFTSHILDKYGSMHEARVIFDRYDVQHSMNQSTRERRLGSQTAVAYHITDSTNITKILMKRLLSHGDMTGYLADKILRQAHDLG